MISEIEPTDRERKLVDIMFQVGILLHQERKHFEGKSTEDVANWITNQLHQCGFPVHPLGSNWGYLTTRAKGDAYWERQDLDYGMPRPKREPGVVEIIESNRFD